MPKVAGGTAVVYVPFTTRSPLILTVSESKSPIETSPAPPTVAENSVAPSTERLPLMTVSPSTVRFPSIAAFPPTPVDCLIKRSVPIILLPLVIIVASIGPPNTADPSFLKVVLSNLERVATSTVNPDWNVPTIVKVPSLPAVPGISG